MLSNCDGVPRALLQTVGLELVTFGEIDESHTAIDGPSLRDLEVWRGVHTTYWNGLLEPLPRPWARFRPRKCPVFDNTPPPLDGTTASCPRC